MANNLKLCHIPSLNLRNQVNPILILNDTTHLDWHNSQLSFPAHHTETQPQPNPKAIFQQPPTKSTTYRDIMRSNGNQMPRDFVVTDAGMGSKQS